MDGLTRVASPMTDLSDEDRAAILAAAKSRRTRPDELLLRRESGEPMELVLGSTRFMDLEIRVEPGVLVPRLETEIVGRAALQILHALGVANPRVIDMCCGAGNLACALAHHVPGARVWAADLTEACVRTARANVQRLGLASRVGVYRGDLFGALDGEDLAGTIDLVVCNPPYISTKRLDGDRKELLRFEPREAFDAGPYGLSIHQRAIAEAPTLLKPGGWFTCEFGAGQERQMQLLFDRTKRYASTRFFADADGTPRAVAAEVG